MKQQIVIPEGLSKHSYSFSFVDCETNNVLLITTINLFGSPSFPTLLDINGRYFSFGVFIDSLKKALSLVYGVEVVDIDINCI